ncbi:RHS repeat-associated protein [Catenuloplanes nepalensis]|uniref:RHS repeat-associated protein n=1 Tax=Catenuloplanes nepalensis TaxID=587533 RepID=A0ABT9MTH4_9ACTN|nr:DNRLRE domain-containing protein [Catenuloplanes nepalensis]MDP9794715.1 RHS repeat-associated protein [Catenuloplanes nepalensis]
MRKHIPRRVAMLALVLAGLLVLTGPGAVPSGLDGFWPRFGDDRPRSVNGDRTEARGRDVPANAPAPEGTLPEQERLAGAGTTIPAAKRVRENVEDRTATTKYFTLADGRVQAEVAAQPVHYRDAQGRWQDIDPTVGRGNTAGYPLAATANTFTSRFGDRTDRIARYELDGRSVTLGLPGTPRPLTPSAKGATVTIPGAFPGATLRYDVTGGALKEQIVLDRPPAGDASFTFTLGLDGVRAAANPDGSIAFRAADGDGRPLFYLPKPFMFDDRDDPAGPDGKAFSPAVTQTLAGDTLTITADRAWLASPDRKYPVVIDPTIKVQPQVGAAQDGQISRYAPAQNYDTLWRMTVGTTPVLSTTPSTFRSLVQFPLTEVPAGTQLDAATLRLYFDQTTSAESDTYALPINAHRVTAPWTEQTVTWNSINTALGEVGTNTEQIDDADAGRAAASGSWPTVAATNAVGGGYRTNSGAVTGDTMTWMPRVTEAGTYDVQVHYVPGADRATNAPYTVHHKNGTTAVAVNQTTGSGGGAWKSIGAFTFDAGTTHKVVLGDVANKTVVADGVRLVKNASVTKGVDQNHAWHDFSVRSIVQDWIAGRTTNNGFMVKAADEGPARGGPRYEGAENAYGGEVDTFPTLVLTWGKPGVTLQPPTTIRATGADLAWSAYTGDDLLEYQVHRSTAQSFIPSERTLVSPVQAGRRSYSDTGGTPTPANHPTEFGAPFYYMIVVKTKSGELIPSPAEQVQLPKAGHVVRILQSGTTDTTLTSAQPGTGHNVLDGGGLIQVGNKGSVYGTSRAVVKFPSMSGLPAGTKVVSAKAGLWGVYTEGGGNGTFRMHGLTTDFDQATASWNRASTATAWGTPGGDFTAAAASSVTNIGADPRWQYWDATGLVQGWVNTPSSNKGLLFKIADEGTAASVPEQRVLFNSGEVPEPKMRPRLEVVYTAPELTYYAPTVPSRMIPGDEYTSPVTLSNASSTTWPAADWGLSYRWELPDGTDVTTADNRRDTPLAADLAPGAVTTVNAKIMTPVRTDQGNTRQAFVLKWDLRNRTTGQWASQVYQVPPLAQRITVEDPTSDQLGLEKFYQYTGENAGAGSTVMVNQFSGNAVFSYNAFSNPSRGLSTFLRLSYNSRDSSNSYIGHGWSLSTTSVTRLGSPLQFIGADPRWPEKVTLTDGDGTSHWFDLNRHGTDDQTEWDYDSPAGVHLYLQRNSDTDAARTWVMTRPDRSRFYFDTDGYQTSVVDKNGNDLRFTYERTSIGGRNTGVLKYVTDATGRRTLTLEYFAPGENFPFYNGSTDPTKRSGTNLTNAQILTQLRSITDISGRRITFTYSDTGQLRQVIDGEGTADEKPFGFYYDTLGNLARVDDPRGHGTKLAYHDGSAADPLKWRVRTVTDRADKATAFTYADPDGSTASFIESTVTDANGHASKYLLDGYGRPTLLTDARNQTTELTWDADNNVRRLAEPNGAVTTYAYDEKTGLPLEIKDPEANKNNTAPQTFGYRFGLNGHVAEMTSKKSPEGREHTFAYDQYGNLTSVTDPKGTSTPLAGDYTSVYTYDTWGQQLTSTDANDNTTRYAEYDPVGYPKKITDALNLAETYVYDAIGNVVSATNAKGHTSSYTYDTFGRPRSATQPKDAANDVYIFTPGRTYDRNDNVVRDESATGGVIEMGHDPADRLVYLSEPPDSPSSPQRITTYEHDAVGNLIRETEPKGTLTADRDDYTTFYTYDELNRLVLATDPNGGRFTSTFDAVGNVLTVADPRKNESGPNAFNEKYTYDLNTRITSVTDAAGNVARTEYDRDGNMVAIVDQEDRRTTLSYDERSMLVEQKVPHKAGETNPPTTRYEYDEVGNRTRVITPRGVATTNDPDDFATRWTYDPLNRMKEQFEPFDRNDSRYTTPDKTIYEYDEVGNQKSVSAPPAEGETDRAVTRYTYWDNGWNRTSTDPFDIKTEYDYDNDGSQTTRTLTGENNKVRTMSWTYFPDGKQKTQRDDGQGGSAPKKTFAFSYDPNANLTEMRDDSADAKIDVYSLVYDELNRPEKVEERLDGTVKNTTTFVYNSNDTVRERTHDRIFSKYEYDVRDLVSKVTTGKTSSDSGAKSTTYTYTKRQQVETEKKGNGNTVSYEYYLDKKLRYQVEKKSSGAVVNEHTIDYDANGHRSKDVAKKQDADNRARLLDTTTTYTYDPRDRIREQKKTGHGADTETYVHDANGNVIEQTTLGTKTTFDYDRNRLLSSSAAGVSSTFKYDDFGRQSSTTTAGKETEKYEYDGFDRVTKHTRTPGGDTEYKYDPLDRQISRKQGDKTTELFYLGLSEQVIAEEQNGKLKKSYNYGPDGNLLSQSTFKDDGSFDESYQSYNPHTDVEQLTDEQGESEATYGYTAYGDNDDAQFTGADKPDASVPEDPNKEPYSAYRFNGKRFDQSSGDYDMGFRDYDPGLNRFLTQDQYNGALSDMNLATDPFTNNRYAFGGGNPVSQVEIDGHFSLSDIGHAALDVVGLVPGVGEVADLANAAWYAAEGDYANAALSAASAVPFAGYAASAVKGAKYVAKGVDAAQGAAKSADTARSGAKAANAAQGGGRAAPAAPKAASGGGGPTAGAKASGGGGSAAPAKSAGGAAPAKASARSSGGAGAGSSAKAAGGGGGAAKSSGGTATATKKGSSADEGKDHVAFGKSDKSKVNIKNFAQQVGARHLMGAPTTTWRDEADLAISKLASGEGRISFMLDHLDGANSGAGTVLSRINAKAGDDPKKNLSATEWELFRIGEEGVLDKVEFYKFSKGADAWVKR